ncbi:FAD-binding protein [Mycolicibacterium moriokaense]|nr:FAD-binding protein [Mycolicibacterium moriokaense]
MHWDEECDVLVVGSGAGGLVGAYTAGRQGLSGILLEATDKYGGTTAYSGGGMWFPVNPVLTRSGVDDTIEDALEYYTTVVGDSTPRELQEAFVRTGAPLVEYLEADERLRFEPYPWPDYFGKAPKASLAGQRHIAPEPLAVADAPELRDVVRGPLDTDRLGTAPPDDFYVGGRALVARLVTAIRQYPNVETRLGTSLTELILQNGAVVGAMAKGDAHGGRPYSIRARAGVLLAAGGFENSQELRAKYGVPGSARDAMGPGSNLGEALQAGIAVGADTALMDQGWWAPGMTHPDGRSAFALWFTGGIFVDQNGNRFVNESQPYDRLGRTVIAGIESGSLTLPYWMIYDDREGAKPPVTLTNVSMVESEKYEAKGLWHTADTLDELATLIGVPPANLVATVAKFNAFAATGVDEDFGRGEEAYDRAVAEGGSPMFALDKPPYHAAAFGLSDLGTKGGLRTDANARVLDTSGEVIGGLYAAGNTMAAPSGNVYPGGGHPIGTSMIFSYLAVRDMLAKAG